MINNYLAYLKDISRKIVSDSGFEKALLDKGIKNPSFSFQKTSNVLNLKPNDEYHKLIRNIDAYLNKNNDKKLFCGFGLIAGTKGRIYAAPLIYLECEITKSEHTYNIDFDFTTTSFNYDLLSSILNYSISRRFSVTDDEDFNEDYQNEVEIVEEIENKIKNIDTVQGLESFANEVFIRLQERLKDFKEIEPHSTNYNLKKEILLFNNKRKSSRSDNRERKSIFETELIYVNASHYFVNTIPHQLSTYEALNQLMDETQKNNFQNISLEKLLKNIITDETNKIDHQEVYELDDIIRKYMPLNFSDAQISAIKNAFGSEISYIQGPPGTGKSYTIGAIVLCALFLGKKVLLVSQKEAALDVIKEKIEPFLTGEKSNSFWGITYYNNGNRQDLKVNISNLTINAQNQTALQGKITRLYNLISDNESAINKLSDEILNLENSLSQNLEKEIEFNKIHNEFIDRRNWFLGMIKTINDIQIDTPYKFKKFGVDEDAYIRHLLMIQDIQNTSPSIVTELFKYKFKNHIKDFFHIDITNIPDNYLYQFCKELIEVNHKHVQSNKIKESIRVDNNQLRSAIEQKKKELRNKQIALIKDRYRYNSLLCLSKNGKEANEVLNNLQKLERMLHWRRPSLIANYMTEIDYNLILKAMPFWISEVRNLGQILPMRSGIFDLVIVDESSQVNLAEILPALYRGNQIVVVGDHHQLGLDSTGVNFRLSNRFDNLIWNKNFNNNGISYAVATEKKLTVTKCSILDFINSPENKDTIRSRMLNEHYRSMPLLAKYTNANFYKGELKVMTERPKNINKDCFKVIEVSGERDKNDTTILTEAKEVVSIIKKLTNSNSDIIDFDLFDISRNDFSIGVISLMTNQRQLIADLIDDEIDEDVVIKHNIDVWTPQSAQGNERDIIIISICLDINCTGKGNYYKNDRLLNVATSRAKKFTFVVHSNFQKNKYEKLGKYVNLSANRYEWTLNRAVYDSEFEKKVYQYLAEYILEKQEFYTIRIYNQVETCGQRRLDFVLFNEMNEKAVAVEVDGCYHYQDNHNTKGYSIDHTDRMNILKRAGWNVINTPYYKWYENGWLCDNNHHTFKKELSRITSELDKYLF